MKPTLLLLFFFQVFFAYAQKDTVYFSNEVYPTSNIKEAKFYSLTPIAEQGEITLFDLKSNAKFLTYKYEKPIKQDFLIRDGDATYFYPNGNIQTKGFFKNGAKVGEWQEFYESSKPKEIVKYDSKMNISGFNQTHLFNYQVVAYWDNLGNKSVDNGEGLYFYRDSLTVLTANIKKGVPDGICKGTYRNNSFIEQYKKGELQKGEIVESGNKITYDKINEYATFHGGIEAMYQFIASNLKYPATAQRYNKQGKVFIKFLIKKDGSITNITVLKGFYEDCDAEAVRVIKLMDGNWDSGKVRGIKEDVLFTMPVSFVLE